MPYTTTHRVLCALTCILLLFEVMKRGVLADTDVPRVVLTPAARGLVVGPGMNAVGRDLRGCEFVGQDLRGAVFDGCNLYGVRIHQCELQRASFRGAVLSGATITDLWSFGDFTALEGADFTDATINGVHFGQYDFHTVDLSPQQLMSTWSYKSKNLRQCVIHGSDRSREPIALDLRGADLREATLRGNLTKCDFTDAQIDQTRWQRCTLAFEQLASTRDFQQHSLHAQFAGRLLGNRDYSRINLTGSDLGTPPPDANFTDAVIDRCTLRVTEAQLYSTSSYKEGRLLGLRMVRQDLSGWDLSGMNLTDCGFSHCKFAGANFDDAVITGASFITDKTVAESDQLTIEQIKSTWNYKHRRMEGIRLPEELAEALRQEKDAGPSQ